MTTDTVFIPGLRVGDVVEVLSEAEILATLDENGELESLPFMPEMLRHCGKRLTVFKVANKVCDTIGHTGMRKMENAVHLSGARCDGSGHAGCQAACLMYFKHAWIRKVEAGASPSPSPGPDPRLLPLLTISSRRPPAEDGTERHRCQATEMLRFTPGPLTLKSPLQFVDDVRTGNAGLLWTIRTVLVAVFDRIQGLSRKVLPARLRFNDGRQWGNLRGLADKTPTVRTDLQPGDTVRIRSKEEVAATLNSDLLNRGLGFDAEMARFCGRTAKVARRVDQIIDEHTGTMIKMKSPCIVLEDVVCEGAFNMSCPRAITPYWREIWLERIDAGRPIDEVAAAGPAVTAGE